MAELSQEEYESLSPSDRAHYDIRGRLGDGYSDTDSDATKTARAAAFGDNGSNPQAEDDVDVDARFQEVEDLKSEAEVSDDGRTLDTDEGVAGEEAAGIGRDSRDPQSTEEAVAAEEERREGFSQSELAEAEARDRMVATAEGEESAAVPNVGSPDEEGREDVNAEDTVAAPGERFGTAETERTEP